MRHSPYTKHIHTTIIRILYNTANSHIRANGAGAKTKVEFTSAMSYELRVCTYL